LWVGARAARLMDRWLKPSGPPETPVSREFKISYVSPSIVQGESDEFALLYEDEQDPLSFSGFEQSHPCGGMLYFPTSAEWDVRLGYRRGQRKLILGRLLDFARRKSHFAFIERSLTDERFFARWPRESNYLGRQYKRLPVREEDVGKCIQIPTMINSTAPSPAVSRAGFDRPFRTVVYKTDLETVRLISDRTARHATRVEFQFLIPQFRQVPETFDGLTVEDITDTETQEGELAQLLEKFKGLCRLFRLEANDGTRGLILAGLATFWEDDAPPGAPSKIKIPGTPAPRLY